MGRACEAVNLWPEAMMIENPTAKTLILMACALGAVLAADAPKLAPHPKAVKNIHPPGEVAERQTRRSQTPLPARECGFESHLRYQLTRAGPRRMDACP